MSNPFLPADNSRLVSLTDKLIEGPTLFEADNTALARDIWRETRLLSEEIELLRERNKLARMLVNSVRLHQKAITSSQLMSASQSMGIVVTKWNELLKQEALTTGIYKDKT